MNLYRLVAVACAALLAGSLGCDQEASTPKAEARPGMGEVITADPPFGIKITLPGSPEASIEIEGFSVYETKSARDGQPQAPQGYELIGKRFALAGRLAPDMKVAPAATFADLVGSTLKVSILGGDSTAPSASKVELDDERVYLPIEGTIAVEKAFQMPGKYAGVSGTFELTLQQMKFGDPDDPNDKGDQKIGDPVKATGTFVSKARSFKYEQM